MLRGPGGEGAHTEWAVLNLGPWGLACGPAGRRELGRAGPGQARPGQQLPALVSQLSHGPGSGCGHAVTMIGRALALCALQSGWNAEELWCPPAPSLVGTQLRSVCLHRGLPPYSPLPFLSPITSVWSPLSESQTCREGEIPFHLSWAFRFRKPSVSSPWDLLQIS